MSTSNDFLLGKTGGENQGENEGDSYRCDENMSKSKSPLLGQHLHELPQASSQFEHQESELPEIMCLESKDFNCANQSSSSPFCSGSVL